MLVKQPLCNYSGTPKELLTTDALPTWKFVDSSNYTATPFSTSVLTMLTDVTGSVKVGMPLRYTIGGTEYYGRVGTITSTALTIAGAPFGGDVSGLYYGGGQLLNYHITIPGLYENASDTALIANDLKAARRWTGEKAYLIGAWCWSRLHDTGSHGQASIRINGSEVHTTAGGPTIAADATWYSWSVNINTAYYDINAGEAIEITCVKGGNGDAQDLTTEMTFLIP